jgi:hypothetical protein
MFQTKKFSSFKALLMLAFLVCVMTLLVPGSLLADGGTTDPPILNPVPAGTSGSDGLTTVVVTLLAVLWSLP